MRKRGQQQYVRVNAAFITPSLSAAAVKVLLLLAAIAQASGTDTVMVSNDRIAERTGLTNISRIIKELYAVGAVVQRVERYKGNRRKCNAYVLSEAILQSDSYAFVPVSALELPKSALRLLIIYALNCDKHGRSLLSLTQLQEISGMARGTVISCTNVLQQYGYIAKQHYQTYDGDYGHNRVYVTHVLRRCHSMRAAEAMRIIINSMTVDYGSKCRLEKALYADRNTALTMLSRAIRQLFRSTCIPLFLRRIMRLSVPLLCRFRHTQTGGSKKIRRFIYLLPALLI